MLSATYINCVTCKHNQEKHSVFRDTNIERFYCAECLDLVYQGKDTCLWIHNFKLDNLSYIEILAKEKGLI